MPQCLPFLDGEAPHCKLRPGTFIDVKLPIGASQWRNAELIAIGTGLGA
jgi:hypothetical protein